MSIRKGNIIISGNTASGGGADEIHVGPDIPEEETIELWVDTADGIANRGLPAGGTTGQVLLKRTDANYDTIWGNFSYSNLINKPTLNGTTINGNIYIKSINGENLVGSGNINLPNTYYGILPPNDAIGRNGDIYILIDEE